MDDKRIEAELTSRMDQMEGQYGSAKNIVEAYGKSIATLKEELRSSLKEQLTGRKMQDKITDEVKITPKEVATSLGVILTSSVILSCILRPVNCSFKLERNSSFKVAIDFP